MDSDDDVPIFPPVFRERHGRKQRREDVKALQPLVQRRNRSHRYKPNKIEDELQRAICGQRKFELINPVLEEDIDRKVSRAADITRLHTQLCTLELQVVSTVVPVHTNNN
jgi:hypothetical protein